jgi:hypothetical protein
MADRAGPKLRMLTAEVRAELPSLDRAVAEMRMAEGHGVSPELDRMRLYAAAAMLDTFYTSVERILERVARAVGALPDGPHWHRELLTSASLDVPAVRPAVLRPGTAAALRRYLSFRHRFRNLYLFDLLAEHLDPLLADAPAIWSATRTDLLDFASELERIAAQLDAAR